MNCKGMLDNKPDKFQCRPQQYIDRLSHLTSHCQCVAELCFPCAELPKYLCDGPCFNASP